MRGREKEREGEREKERRKEGAGEGREGRVGKRVVDSRGGEARRTVVGRRMDEDTRRYRVQTRRKGVKERSTRGRRQNKGG